MTDHEITQVLDNIPAQVAWRRPDSIARETPDWFKSLRLPAK
jgi:hypothetical protein